MINNDVYKYQYPNNLESKPLFVFWQYRDIVILIFAGLISLFIWLKLGSIIPLLASVIYGIFTIQLSGDTPTIMQYIVFVINYVFGAKIWRYTPGEFDSNVLEVTELNESHVHKKVNFVFSIGNSKTKTKDKPKKKQQVIVKKASVPTDMSKARQDTKLKEKITTSKPKKHANKSNAVRDISHNTILLKKAITAVCCALLIAVCVIAYKVIAPKLDEKFGNHNENITINYSSDTDIPWYSGTVDPLSFVDKTDDEVTATPSEIDSTRLGSVTVTYTVKDKNGNKKDFTREYNVVDKDSPIITFKSKDLTIHQGDAFDPKSNIDSVVDKVDGALSYSSDATFESYTITSDVDPNTAGDYKVTVSAIDSNGNEITDFYSVSVVAQ